MRTKIPSQVRITSKISYEVVYTDQFKDPKVVGESRPGFPQIAIQNGLSNTETVKTFIHEVLHAIATENDFTLTENQVLALEDGIYRVLRLNKWLK